MALIILCLIMAAAFYLITVLYALCWTRHLTAQVEFGQRQVNEGDMVTIREQPEAAAAFNLNRQVSVRQKSGIYRTGECKAYRQTVQK